MLVPEDDCYTKRCVNQQLHNWQIINGREQCLTCDCKKPRERRPDIGGPRESIGYRGGRRSSRKTRRTRTRRRRSSRKN